ncbi:MAG: hypothetical protein ACJAT2_003419, partial [Bacteriovoracaceae bacterium]
EEEQQQMIVELDRLENIMNNKFKVVFSISKYEDFYSGSLKVEGLDIFSYGKDNFPNALFDKLKIRISKDIFMKSDEAFGDKSSREVFPANYILRKYCA